MPKIKHLLPSLREKKRYLAYEVLTEQPLNKDFSAQLIGHVHRLLGLFDAAQAGVQSVQYDAHTQKGILRVGHRYADKVRAAFVLLSKYESQETLCRTLTVSGVLAKTKKMAEGD